MGQSYIEMLRITRKMYSHRSEISPYIVRVAIAMKVR